MTRGELQIIYSRLSDTEKKEWAHMADYASYQGLYRYLKVKSEYQCSIKVVDALVYTIGQEVLDKFIIEIRSLAIGKPDIEELKNLLIKNILNTHNKEILKKIKQDTLIACDNQLLRLEIQGSTVG